MKGILKLVDFTVKIFHPWTLQTLAGAPTGKKLALYKRTFTPIHILSTTKCKLDKWAIFVSVNFDNINAHYINWNI
jgi:hypothetical protein